MNGSDRRSFLRGSALLAASAFLLSRDLAAQEPQNADKGQAGPAEQAGRDDKGQEGQDKDGQAGQEGQAGNTPSAKEGDGAQTFVGADGRPYRVCPQCGANMYKQNRTWTCENCGYSYEE